MQLRYYSRLIWKEWCYIPWNCIFPRLVWHSRIYTQISQTSSGSVWQCLLPRFIYKLNRRWMINDRIPARDNTCKCLSPISTLLPAAAATPHSIAHSLDCPDHRPCMNPLKLLAFDNGSATSLSGTATVKQVPLRANSLFVSSNGKLSNKVHKLWEQLQLTKYW